MSFAKTLSNPPGRIPMVVREFERLLDPASDAALESLAARSQALTRQHFGRTMRLFAPLYVSNECINNCKYCGFSRDNPILRVTLPVESVAAEARHLAAEGFRNILLVAGEQPEIRVQRLPGSVRPGGVRGGGGAGGILGGRADGNRGIPAVGSCRGGGTGRLPRKPMTAPFTRKCTPQARSAILIGGAGLSGTGLRRWVPTPGDRRIVRTGRLAHGGDGPGCTRRLLAEAMLESSRHRQSAQVAPGGGRIRPEVYLHGPRPSCSCSAPCG